MPLFDPKELGGPASRFRHRVSTSTIATSPAATATNRQGRTPRLGGLWRGAGGRGRNCFRNASSSGSSDILRSSRACPGADGASPARIDSGTPPYWQEYPVPLPSPPLLSPPTSPE